LRRQRGQDAGQRRYPAQARSLYVGLALRPQALAADLDQGGGYPGAGGGGDRVFLQAA
jgi:hypothetical protein